ncbi:MAG: hypothetical protein ACW974_11740 [Candidatus Thorarchaeota archaeon]
MERKALLRSLCQWGIFLLVFGYIVLTYRVLPLPQYVPNAGPRWIYQQYRTALDAAVLSSLFWLSSLVVSSIALYRIYKLIETIRSPTSIGTVLQGRFKLVDFRKPINHMMCDMEEVSVDERLDIEGAGRKEAYLFILISLIPLSIFFIMFGVHYSLGLVLLAMFILGLGLIMFIKKGRLAGRGEKFALSCMILLWIVLLSIAMRILENPF